MILDTKTTSLQMEWNQIGPVVWRREAWIPKVYFRHDQSHPFFATGLHLRSSAGGLVLPIPVGRLHYFGLQIHLHSLGNSRIPSTFSPPLFPTLDCHGTEAPSTPHSQLFLEGTPGFYHPAAWYHCGRCPNMSDSPEMTSGPPFLEPTCHRQLCK